MSADNKRVSLALIFGRIDKDYAQGNALHRHSGVYTPQIITDIDALWYMASDMRVRHSRKADLSPGEAMVLCIAALRISQYSRGAKISPLNLDPEEDD